jgi:CRISPR-associated endonuclease/helicase Cas3
MSDIPTDFWAKLKKNPKGTIVRWHHYVAHAADVAAVVEALLTNTIMNRRLAKIAGWDSFSNVHVARLSFLAAIHDAGKANIGFQNKMKDNPEFVAGHVEPILNLLNADLNYQNQLLLPLGIGEILDWFQEDGSSSNCFEFLCATWAHHGKPVKPGHDFRAKYWTPDSTRNPADALNRLGIAAKSWFSDGFQNMANPFPSNHALIHAFNGLLTLADWIGSDTRFFDFSDYSEAYISEARVKASNAVLALFLNPNSARSFLRTQTIGFSLFCDFPPYPIQDLCLKSPVYPCGSISVLESDTGSGKTESAIARFLVLYEQGMVDGMYFAVPTRSAATQLYDRVKNAVAKTFTNKETRPPVVQAVSGYIKVDGVEGVPLPHFEVLWPDDSSSNFDERAWAGESSKRYLAGAIVIGTIDQVLLSGLSVKHAHLRATSLLRHFLVVDEVHSSDTYMTRLLQRVLDFHLAAGGHAMLMSATLGIAARLTFLKPKSKDVPNLTSAINVLYPLLSYKNVSQTEIKEETGSSSGLQKRIIMETSPSVASYDIVSALAVKFAAQGARVLIIRNLVRDCILTHQALETTPGVKPEWLFNAAGINTPHHSRYAPDDRKLLDKSIEAYFGKNSRPKAMIVVATQTVEQSLDIDADILITDLCPVDVLLQRLGRLHRHTRSRPEAFLQPRCIVLTSSNRDLGVAISESGFGRKGKHGLGTVYEDLRVLEATWRLLEKSDISVWDIPEQNRHLVESGTHPEVLDTIVSELGENWVRHQQAIDGNIFAQQQIFRLSSFDFNLPFSETNFSGQLSRIKTRLGTDDVKVILPSRPNGPFRQSVAEINISARYFKEAFPDKLIVPESDIQTNKSGFSFTFSGKQFVYNRFGLTSQP